MFRVLLPLLSVCFFVANASASLRLPALIGDHMMLQADRPVALWGWTDPGGAVEVTLQSPDGQALTSFQAKADAAGRWSGLLPAQGAKTAGRLEITAGADRKVIEDVFFGQVWLASGQSNMGFSVGALNVPKERQEAQKAYADSIKPNIRLFKVEEAGADAPADDVKGEWVITTSENVRHFSAVSWYFAQELQKQLNEPVGMIVSSVGGTFIETWLPKEVIDKTSVAGNIRRRNEKSLEGWEPRMKKYREELAKFEQKYPNKSLQFQHNSEAPKEPYSPTYKNVPSRLFNGMIAGLVPYTVSGVIWYQGENNSGHPEEYTELFRAHIENLRALWKEELPFYYVEIANVKAPQAAPSEGGWALIREAQAGVLDLPKTGVATAVDLGEAEEVHYPQKWPLGQRLAHLALADVYGRTGPDPRSPEYAGFKVEDGKVRITLRHAGALQLRDGQFAGFAVRGATGGWEWAEGKIDGDSLLVWSPKVPEPAAVRYGWATNPKLSVFTKEGLPLRPFRTDPESKDQ